LKPEADVIIIGAGIGGLTLALSLHQIGVSCKVYESVRTLREVGAGINLMPHAVREFDELGLLPALDATGIRTRDASYFNQFGQHIYTEPAGEAAGYPWPQFSIHRADVQMTLLNAVKDRLGEDSVATGYRCVEVKPHSEGALVRFESRDGEELSPALGRVVVGADGINSVVRNQSYPDEGPPIYSGITIWRGVTASKPFLSGANTARIGWMPCGKMTVYPVRNEIDGDGTQLVNWVASLERPRPTAYDWNGEAALEDFFEPFSNWHFEWLDVAALLEKTYPIMVFPMVDRDPVPTWTFGPVTLLGDAAHPMYPRGSNGAGQAVIDARFLTGCFKRHGVTEDALAEYDTERVARTAEVVRANRLNPPDAILREVYERTDGKPFDSIEDVIPRVELEEIAENYRRIARFDVEHLTTRPAFV